MMGDDMSDLELRVARLERTNRWLKGGALMLMGVALLALDNDQGGAEVIEAHRFVLLDGEGGKVGELKVEDGSPGLLMYDAAGVTRVSLSHDDEATALYLRDGDGDVRVGVAQFAHGGGGVALHGPESKGAAVLYFKDEGSLTLYGSDGEVVGRLPAR